MTLRQTLADVLDPRVADAVRNLRNITEHWDENRRFFEDASLPGKRSSSVRWYLDQDLINSPWSFTWSIDSGYELAEVLKLDDLLAEFHKVDVILNGPSDPPDVQPSSILASSISSASPRAIVPP